MVVLAFGFVTAPPPLLIVPPFVFVEFLFLSFLEQPSWFFIGALLGVVSLLVATISIVFVVGFGFDLLQFIDCDSESKDLLFFGCWCLP